MSSEQLQDYCRENLAKYKVPSILEIVKEILKTAVGKSVKLELRDRIAGKYSK